MNWTHKLRPGLLAIVLVAVGPPVALARQAGPQPKKETKPPVYQVVFLRLGPKWVKGTPLAEQPLGEKRVREAAREHSRYMDSLFETGRMVIGGPFVDDPETITFTTISGAMLVLRAETAEAARRMAEADPAVQAGIFEVAEVRLWAIALSRCQQ